MSALRLSATIPNWVAPFVRVVVRGVVNFAKQIHPPVDHVAPLTLPDFAKRIRPGRHQDHFAVRRADGRYRINYRADFRPESFADVLKRWLAKDGKLITKQLAEAA